MKSTVKEVLLEDFVHRLKSYTILDSTVRQQLTIAQD